jgi:hypothetical protein
MVCWFADLQNTWCGVTYSLMSRRRDVLVPIPDGVNDIGRHVLGLPHKLQVKNWQGRPKGRTQAFLEASRILLMVSTSIHTG